jgi:phosphatidylglycerol lysyltransferase
MLKRTALKSLVPLLGLVLFSMALWVLHRELARYRLHDVLRELAAIPATSLWLAVLLTVSNYVVMTGYDAIALRYIRHRLPYRKIFFTSFVGYAFSQNIGMAFVSGASVRFHIYPGWGLSTEEITKVVAMGSVSFTIGLFTVAGAIFLAAPIAAPSALNLPLAIRPLGFLMLLGVAIYLFLCLRIRRPLTLRGWTFQMPSYGTALFQIGISSLDWAMAGGVLYALLPQGHGISFSLFLGFFLLAQIAGLLSQVPGGLGVFEAVMLLILRPNVPSVQLLGALLAYRGLYYLFPLSVAIVLFASHEALKRKEAIRQTARFLGYWVPELTPYVLAAATFIGGAVLIFSGALPAESARLAWLRNFVPLSFIETSHFLGSIAGMGLLLLARGLLRRLDAAYFLSVILLAFGVVLSLLKGFDYEEAIILSVILAALVPSRRFFYREASLLSGPLSLQWLVAIFLVLACSVWLGLFSIRHFSYSHELWWRFTLNSDASRFLRGTVGASVLLLVFAISKLFSPVPRKTALPGAAELEVAWSIVAHSRKTTANLAMLGDKALLFNDPGDAFIMYGIEGQSWVSMGDPVGPRRQHAELVWRFGDLCDRYDGWPVFYEVGPESLPLYLDMGLSFFKMGEEGRVRLEGFSLEGSQRKPLRHTVNKLEKEGCSFEIVPAEATSSYISRFRAVSDAWLGDKKTGEKAFSMGFFKEDYLLRYPAAVVRSGDEVVAFANIWQGAEKEELSIDLMRYLPGSPHGVMDYLFARLMLWGRDAGYSWFNLGMSPFSAVEEHPATPLWNRLATFIYRYGEHFYNFQGLRQYKEKFGPVWEPRYIACPGGFRLPRILTALISLVSGGLKKAVTR